VQQHCQRILRCQLCFQSGPTQINCALLNGRSSSRKSRQGRWRLVKQLSLSLRRTLVRQVEQAQLQLQPSGRTWSTRTEAMQHRGVIGEAGRVPPRGDAESKNGCNCNNKQIKYTLDDCYTAYLHTSSKSQFNPTWSLELVLLKKHTVTYKASTPNSVDALPTCADNSSPRRLRRSSCLNDRSRTDASEAASGIQPWDVSHPTQR
jgi:hypothetical protein